MRVVVVSAWPPWLEGHGGTLVLHHHLRELATRHDIVLLSASAPTATAPIPAGANVPNLDVAWFGTDRKPGLDYALRRAAALAAREPAHVGYVLRPALLSRLTHEIKTADLVYGFGWGTAPLHRHTSGLPVVHTAVDAWALGRTGRLLDGWRRVTDLGETSAIVRHEANHYPRLAAVTVVAETDAAYLRGVAPGAKIEVVTNGVEAGEAPIGAPPLDPPVLGFHGNFSSEHNVDGARILVTEILPLVRRSVPEVRVLLAGREPGPDVEQLVGDDVELFADAPDLRPLLDRVTVGVAVMNSGTGLKNKVLETMAAGRPVVANAAGLNGLGAGEGLLAARDAADAADVIVALLRDQGRLETEGKAARQRVEADYTWQASATQLEQVWREAVGR